MNMVDNHWYGLLITKVYEDLRDENVDPAIVISVGANCAGDHAELLPTLTLAASP